MHMLNQMDPDLYREVLRKQARVWEDLFVALTDARNRWAARRASEAETGITLEDVLADLAYGRD